MHGTIVNNA